MNVVFIGSSKFGYRCLEAILQIKSVKVVGAVTAPQTFSISYNKGGVKNVLHADISALCEQNEIPVEVISDGMRGDDLFSAVQSWSTDIFIVSGWYHMVPKKWRDLAPAYGLHASLLPRYTGGAPLVWAIINGEKETGISFFQFGDGVDSGPIVGQSKTPISSDDTIATVYSRIEDLGVELLRDVLPKLADGSALHQIQDETLRTTFPQRSPPDGLINWDHDAHAVHDFVRAQTKPYPGAFMLYEDKPVTIWSGQSVEKDFPASSLPGEIQIEGASVFVKCKGNSAYQLAALCVDGKDMDATTFVTNILAAEKTKVLS